ncbi:hypothetical protein TNCV_4027141 [Trichonephila clavipes]|nr:hypothetical protein TNCV_4027141 [Trichonephila clavipes]
MNVNPRKRTRIVALNQHTSLTVSDIASAVGVGKSSVSRIINQQKKFGQCLQNKRVNVDANFDEGLLKRVDMQKHQSKKMALTPAMKKTRLDWTRKHQFWTAQAWKKVVFSDEKHFSARVLTKIRQAKWWRTPRGTTSYSNNYAPSETDVLGLFYVWRTWQLCTSCIDDQL